MGRSILALVLSVLAYAGSFGAQSQSSPRTLAPHGSSGLPMRKRLCMVLSRRPLAAMHRLRKTAFGEAQVPSGSVITLHSDGHPKYVNLTHDASVLGYRCRGGGGSDRESDTTAFYPTGKLKLCWLAGNQDVQGIPCMDAGGFLAAIFHYGGGATEFYENGKLHRCTVSKDFGVLRRGTRFVQAP